MWRKININRTILYVVVKFILDDKPGRFMDFQEKSECMISIEEIKSIRKKLKLTQEAFAKLLGTTFVTVNRWEQGRAYPSRLYRQEIKKVADGNKAC